MQKITIQGEYRKTAGKGVARQLRMRGKIPAGLYSKGVSKPLTLNPKEVSDVLHSVSGVNTLITLDMTGDEKGQHVAILRDYQKDPLNGALLHADLFELSMTEPLEVKVVIEITGGTPIGVKRDGGVLRTHLRELEVRVLPTNIPDHIQVDVSQLALGETIHIGDLSLDEGIEALGQTTQAVVSVASTMSDEQLDALLTTPADTDAEPVAASEDEEPKAEDS
ncbi:MAG: 50S ribosomal protein L25 [Nitrospirota bacterium]|nr:50S ribosomal protein L25 [Nitrospirota bacterium]